mgnify:CR=1 FL=1
MASGITRRHALSLVGAAAAAPLADARPALADARPAVAGAAGPDVTLVDDGASVTLANGIVQVTVTKATARITDLRLLTGTTAGNLLSGGHGGGYTTFNYPGESAAGGLKAATFQVISETPDRVEIEIEDQGPGFVRSSVPDPTAEELRLIREELDPDGVYVKG